ARPCSPARLRSCGCHQSHGHRRRRRAASFGREEELSGGIMATRAASIDAPHEQYTTAMQYRNLAPAELVEHAIRRGEGELSRDGAFVARTAPHTGRSPNDKYVVREPSSADRIWWGSVNVPMEPAQFA